MFINLDLFNKKNKFGNGLKSSDFKCKSESIKPQMDVFKKNKDIKE